MFNLSEMCLESLTSEQRISAWKLLLDFGSPFGYGRDSEVFAQGTARREMFLLSSGVVKRISALPDGREVILDLRYPGQWLDEEGVSCCCQHHGHEHPSIQRTLSAMTLTPCAIYRISVATFFRLISTNFQALRLYSSQCAEDMRTQITSLISLKALTAGERLEYFLKHLGSPAPAAHKLKGSRPSTLSLRDYEIAGLIGISKQHFSAMKRKIGARD